MKEDRLLRLQEERKIRHSSGPQTRRSRENKINRILYNYLSKIIPTQPSKTVFNFLVPPPAKRRRKTKPMRDIPVVNMKSSPTIDWDKVRLAAMNR